MTKRRNQPGTFNVESRHARPAAIEHCPPGYAPQKLRAGDFGLCRASTTKGKGGATTTLGQFIQTGERVEFGPGSEFARWTHSFLVVGGDGDIVEAIESGVQQRNVAKYRQADYMIVSPRADAHQRELACDFACDQVGDKYGILNFAGLAAQALFGVNLAVHMDNQFICSGLVARATEKYIATYPKSPEDMMPADLAHYWGAQSGEKPLRPSWWSRVLIRVSGVLRAIF